MLDIEDAWNMVQNDGDLFDLPAYDPLLQFEASIRAAGGKAPLRWARPAILSPVRFGNVTQLRHIAKTLDDMRWMWR